MRGAERAKTLLMQQASRLSHRLWWTRAVTLGVRVAVVDASGVFLVRHTYLPGWYLPGGAVDRGESAEAAAVRELREEGDIICSERPRLFGFYRNPRQNSRDHVACYVVRRFERGPRFARQSWEIAEAGFFPLAALPHGTTIATRTRLAEILEGRPISETW